MRSRDEFIIRACRHLLVKDIVLFPMALRKLSEIDGFAAAADAL